MRLNVKNLRVHAWGGLGSQLFAVALVKDLELEFPKKSFTIVLHTGGVTQRKPEICSLFSELDYEFIDDYAPIFHSQEGKSFQTATMFRVLVRRFLSFSRFIVDANDDKSSSHIRRWTISTRGHYSYRSIGSTFLEMLSHRVGIYLDEEPRVLKQNCAVHYRLGDLLSLSDKSPIDPNLVLREIRTIHTQSDFVRVDLYSDSPDHAMNALSQGLTIPILLRNANSFEVIAEATHAKYFIGTSSKISFWIASIRARIYNRPSSIPQVNRHELQNMVGDFQANLHYF
jgi:hypothetical protein